MLNNSADGTRENSENVTVHSGNLLSPTVMRVKFTSEADTHYRMTHIEGPRS